MNKVRSDALWSQLSPEQRKTLDRWLFEENLSYEEALSRAQRELCFKGHLSSLKRYYRKRTQDWVMEHAAEEKESPGDVAALKQATIKMAGTYAYQQLLEAPEEVGKWGPALKLVVQNDYNELVREAKAREFDVRREGFDLRRELKAGDQKLRREAIEFGKEKFRYDMIENAVKALPELQKVAEAMGDADSTRYRESTNKVKQIMFAAPHEPPSPKPVACAPSPQPNGFPSPPQVSSPKEDERFALRGPPVGAREKNGPHGDSEVQRANFLSGNSEPEVLPGNKPEQAEAKEGEN